jgi:hypothetical protein
LALGDTPLDDGIASILDGISRDDIGRVASGTLGRDVNVVGQLTYAEITTPHAEARTVGIVKVAGQSSGGPWSSVVKLLDMAVAAEHRFVGVTQPETEELLYEGRYLADRNGGFRPARCYLISRPLPSLKLLWLEDLTSAASPPFSLDQLREMAGHFGAWNGAIALEPPEFGFPLLRNAFAHRFRSWSFEMKLGQLMEHADHPLVRDLYRDHPLNVLADFAVAMERLLAWGEGHPGTLAFGDCSVGNLFHRPGETIGIDWASLTLDPMGVDAGCSIGSSITWGRDFVSVAQRERELFDCYLTGLADAGWRGNLDDVRRGYFCLFGFYVGATLTNPLNVMGADKFLARSFLEKRYGMPMEELPAAAAPIVDLVPAWTREIDSLLR